MSLAPVAYAVIAQRARGVHLLLPDLDCHAAELCRPTDEGLGRRRVTAFLVILDAALTLAAGAALAGLVRTHLTLVGASDDRPDQRSSSSAPAATYGLSLLVGLNTATVLLGPALVLAAGARVSLLTVNPRATWHASWVETRDRWAQRIPWMSIVAFVGGGAVGRRDLRAHRVHGCGRSRGGISDGVGGLVAAPDHRGELCGRGATSRRSIRC